MDIENAKKHLSDLQKERRKKKIALPRVFKGKALIREEHEQRHEKRHEQRQAEQKSLGGECPRGDALEKHFPYIFKKPVIYLCAEKGEAGKPVGKPVGGVADALANRGDDALPTALPNGINIKESLDEADSAKLLDGNCAGNSATQELLEMNAEDGDTLNLGVLFTGLPAPGGHNVICGVLDSLKKKNRKNTLFGFLNGFEGVKSYSFMELKNEYISMFRNSGGFDMLRSSSFDSLSESGKRKCFKICRQLNLAGLIIVGGVDSQRQVASLAEYFEQVHVLAGLAAEGEVATAPLDGGVAHEPLDGGVTHAPRDGDDPTYQIVSDLSDEEIKAKYPRRGKKRSKRKTCVVCAPKSVCNEMDSDLVECSLGFDTTVFTCCQYISFLTSHVRTYQSGYHFVRVIGNSSSHVALECFLQTKANIVLISEEIKKKKKKLKDVIDFIVHVVQRRYHLLGRSYGIVIVPEGLLGKIEEFKKMVRGLLLARKRALHDGQHAEDGAGRIVAQFYEESAESAESAELFRSLPAFFQKHLLEEVQSERFQYARLKTEELLLSCVKEKIEQTKMKGIHFASHAYTKEVTCSLPSNFDCAYSYLLGMGCVEIAQSSYNGYLCTIRQLKNLIPSVEKVQVVGVPLCRLLRVKGEPQEGRNLTEEHEEGHNLMVAPEGSSHIGSAANPSEDLDRLEKSVSAKRAKVKLNGGYFLTYKKHRAALLYADAYRTHGGIQFERSVADDGEEHSADSPSKLKKLFSSTFSTWDSKWGELFNRVNFTVSGLSGGLMRHNSQVVYVDSHFASKLSYTPFEHIQKITDFYVVKAPQVNVKGRVRCSESFISEERNVGVVLLSHSVPGVNNILAGLHERLSMNNIKLIAFVRGIRGLLTNETYVVKDSHLGSWKNLGGAPLLGVQLEWRKDDGEVVRLNNLVEEKYIKEIIITCKKNKMTHLVFIGDEKVITIMNILNDHFMKNRTNLQITTVPVSLYNSFYANLIECSIGYHSMVYTMSDLIGNLQSCAVNAGSYYCFVKVPTNLSSLSVLSIQLETHCNVCLVGECVEYQMMSLQDLVEQTCSIIIERINRGKFYGTILFSSNLLLNVSDFSRLVADVEEHVRGGDALDRLIDGPDLPDLPEGLSQESAELLRICTKSVREKLLRKENRHDDQVDCNFEDVFVEQIKRHIGKLTEQAKQANEPYSFDAHMSYLRANGMPKNVKLYSDLNYMQHFNCVVRNIDREINCCIPTHLDNSLAFSHGLLAGIAIENDLANYVTSIRHLHLNKKNWSSSLYPGSYFVNRDDAGGVAGYPYAAPVPVSVKSSQMATIKHNAETWAYNDCYIFVGPYQHEVNADSPGCSAHMF
ncbi:ATP-dependent phosphofructokinase [Plasmodium vivax North Korean]|uniref:ATP-dependent phosphofructokinase n=1 Tax=Plasmodium vivax North Korean TaxID=1035514 RepID=A0A0J9TXH3_PLAVI|nr:ATP-dependent phosphofructokinase [Plasmodium vivax North Korean]